MITDTFSLNFNSTQYELLVEELTSCGHPRFNIRREQLQYSGPYLEKFDWGGQLWTAWPKAIARGRVREADVPHKFIIHECPW